jgi:hypothetical protein
MASLCVEWSRPSVHSDGWSASCGSNYCEIDNGNDNTPREDRPTAYYDDDAEDDGDYDDGDYDDDGDYEDEDYDERLYDDDEWREFERDYEYDHREHSGLCTGYRDDYNDDDDDE